MYREIQAQISSIIERIADTSLFVPLPDNIEIEPDTGSRDVIICLSYGYSSRDGNQYRFILPARRFGDLLHRLNIHDLQSIVRSSYTDYNERFDRQLFDEAVREVRSGNLDADASISLIERVNFLRDTIEEFYRGSTYQIDRVFTLRNLETELNYYFPYRGEDVRNYDRIGDYVIPDTISFMRQGPNRTYEQPRVNNDYVIQRRNDIKEIIKRYLLGELPPEYFSEQIRTLTRINSEYERIYNFNRRNDRYRGDYYRGDTWREVRARQLQRYEQLQQQINQFQNTQGAFPSYFNDRHLQQILGNFEDPRSEERKKAAARGEKLLLENLTKEQEDTYKKHQYIIVKGGETGKSYKIKKGIQMNVYELDDKGEELVGWCFIPIGCLCSGDVMLAQKIGLELHEKESLKVANVFADKRSQIAIRTGRNNRGFINRIIGWDLSS